ncbi:Aste57867_731 [Aphanomyces stellatus]|uniref:Aste57867_731 protein n=1 Tax=Aphanomyces stellatus TaxID=120398 RepID=A0A485K3Q7_9STRA|nr:hypothetical protein As57867_000730 [Aphanomyces stellatus]VFT77955.1 Aste57867_731 [Aphanomyces stellatus]
MSNGDSVFVAGGSSIRIQTAALHRNPLFWTSPNAFVPERFVEGSAEWNADLALRGWKVHTSFYMPFGMGGMQCLAYRCIMVQMEVIVATFVGRFDFKLAPDAQLKRRFNGFTMPPTKLSIDVRHMHASRA